MSHAKALPDSEDYLSLLIYLSFFSFRKQTFGRQSESIAKTVHLIKKRMRRSICILEGVRQALETSEEMGYGVNTHFFGLLFYSNEI